MFGCNRNPAIATLCTSITPSGATVKLDGVVTTGICTNIDLLGIPVTKTIEVSHPGYATYVEEHTFVSKEIYNLVVELDLIECADDSCIAPSTDRKGLSEFTPGIAERAAQETIAVNETYSVGSDYALDITGPLSSLSIAGRVIFNSDAGLVRVILADKNQNEHLVYETYPLLADNANFKIDNVCEETCLLDSVSVDHLRIEIVDATLKLDGVYYIISSGEKSTDFEIQKENIKSSQDSYKIQMLNEQVQAKGLDWVAGETSISGLSYEEKKRLFASEDGTPALVLPNLQGFEYYKGGIFEIKLTLGQQALEDESAERIVADIIIPDRWDWRDAHGENWVTPVKRQVGGSCWAYCAVAAVEANINLYYNQHLDIDISEQDTVCRHPGSCAGAGGSPSAAMMDFIDTGLVDDACYPTVRPCDDHCSYLLKCQDAADRLWFIESYNWIAKDDDSLMKEIIENGPITFSILSWNHCVTAVGWEISASDPIWTIKNSWGSDWGDNGYVYLIVPSGDRFSTYYAQRPYFVNEDIYEINCVDNDNDGYCNWGISDDKPANCPSSCANNYYKDFNDADVDVRCIPICAGKSCGRDGCGGSCENKCELPQSCGYTSNICLDETYLCKAGQKIGDMDRNSLISNMDVKLLHDMWKAYANEKLSFVDDNICCVDVNQDGSFTHNDWEALDANHESPGICPPSQPPPPITVTSPNGGEKWYIGTNHTITWVALGIKKVDILLVGSRYDIIADGFPNIGSYIWTIPANYTPLDDGAYKIRICNLDHSICDDSDNYFSIVS